MKKLICLPTTRGRIVLTLDSHQKEDSDQSKLTFKFLINQNSKFIALDRGYSLAYKGSGLPLLIAAPKWQWNTGPIHYIRRRSHSCIYNGIGSQDLYWRKRDMKIAAVLGKWYMYNKATGEEVATSGYIPSDPVIVRTSR